MNCCSECFSSSYLKGIINSNPTIGDCNFCGSKGVSIYNPKSLSLFFQNILDLYEVNPKIGESIEIQIDVDFKGKIFSSNLKDNRKKLLNEIIADDAKHYKKMFEGNVVLKHLNNIAKKNIVKPLQISWEKFANEIKSTNRFHIQNALDLTKLEHLLKRYERIIPRGKIYHRARICTNITGFEKGDMSNPPVEKAKAGRANPLGISYLYLADDIKTTLYEARASLFDYVSVGDFRSNKQMKVINLRGDTYDPIFLAEQGELEDFLIHLPFITKLEKELSRTRRRNDNELDYLPTQYLSEFIKSIGFDGVEYLSSLYSSGYNLAIFNPKKLDCIKVRVYEIESINLKHKMVNYE